MLSILHPKFYPTTYALSADGKKVIDSLAGYRTKEKFVRFFIDTYEIETSEDDDL